MVAWYWESAAHPLLIHETIAEDPMKTYVREISAGLLSLTVVISASLSQFEV